MLLPQGSGSRHGEASRDVPSILVIDRQMLTRGCVVEILRSEFSELEVVGSATAVDLDDVKGRNVRLVVLNIESSAVTDASVLQDLAALKRAFPGAPIAVMSQRNDHPVISQAMQCGVRCYLPTCVPLEIAVAALRLALVGGVYYPRQIAPDATVPSTAQPAHAPSGNGHATVQHPDEASGKTRQGIADGACSFTRREVEVLAALQRGRSNKLIACELGMSENTVKVHIQRIMRKLRASNRTEAVLISQQHLSLRTMEFVPSSDTVAYHGPNSASAASGRR